MNNTAFKLFKKGENKMKFLILKRTSFKEVTPMKYVCKDCDIKYEPNSCNTLYINCPSRNKRVFLES